MSGNLPSGTCDRCGQPISGEYGYQMLDRVERPAGGLFPYPEDESHFICSGCALDFNEWMRPTPETLDYFVSIRPE